ncbi:uncharacterized protein PHACADRAFT_23893 [Phanerochaete carnosa HHB-10118-sp]|uniref:Uncharacterized protein n=1 Tax=Phanerochaete carnosa (strain HHB-10118-sp) TaxID=650164 RepID=K5WN18_PHACS|nr:uncharacterized protein PHACADRAFT_23893 [Phanerochaete carnosa HHB-10118-sp]EKM60614.1 hypothetical protein PHACADRAFT_23893 [Phanerochaete carnosa HHB-10118-sp]
MLHFRQSDTQFIKYVRRQALAQIHEPVVSCLLGKLYNKDAIIEYLLDNSAYGDGEEICGHIRSLKDAKTLKLTPNTSKKSSTAEPSPDRAQFVCPLTLREMNGAQPFVYLWTCGCVFSQAGLRAVTSSPSPREDAGKLENKDSPESNAQDNNDSLDTDPVKPTSGDLDLCPQCGAKYSRAEDVLTLNPVPKEESKMFDAMLKRRAAEPAKKGKKRKGAVKAEAGAEPPTKQMHPSASPAPSLNPSITAASRAVAESLAIEEAKRKATMSQAVKSLYESNNTKETFMTRGTFTRYA